MFSFLKGRDIEVTGFSMFNLSKNYQTIFQGSSMVFTLPTEYFFYCFINSISTIFITAFSVGGYMTASH